MMSRSIYIILFCILPFHFFAQMSLNGTWEGAMTPDAANFNDSRVFYIDFKQSNDQLKGDSEEEVYNTDLYAFKQFTGSIKDQSITLNQERIVESERSSTVKWCRLNIDLKYDSVTGYLTGRYNAYDCKRTSGTIVLYKTDNKEIKKIGKNDHLTWFNQFLLDFKSGFSAPLIRQQEMENFKFEPVYFDFDKAEIRPEHEEFLERLIHVVKQHSDLRVKVTGHTDSDGTDSYNDDLSKRRAEAIINYFVKHGLTADRLEFDFKGEREPADTNSTSEGKQKNRRVDFGFI